MFVVFVNTCVTVNSHYFIFLPAFQKSREKAFRIFRAGLCDPARLLTNQIACFTVVIRNTCLQHNPSLLFPTIVSTWSITGYINTERRLTLLASC